MRMILASQLIQSRNSCCKIVLRQFRETNSFLLFGHYWCLRQWSRMQVDTFLLFPPFCVPPVSLLPPFRKQTNKLTNTAYLCKLVRLFTSNSSCFAILFCCIMPPTSPLLLCKLVSLFLLDPSFFAILFLLHSVFDQTSYLFM